MKEFKNKSTNYFWIIIFYMSIAFLFFFVLYGFKSVTGDVCSNNIASNELGTSSFAITDSTNYTIPIVINDKDFQNVEEQIICLQISGNTSVYNSLTYDEKKVYVNNLTTDLTCFSPSTNLTNEWLLFSCTDCTSNSAISVSLSKETSLLLDDGTAFQTTNWFYQIINRESCKEFYKSVVNYYFAFLGLILFIFLLIRGFNWFEKWVFEGLR